MANVTVARQLLHGENKHTLIIACSLGPLQSRSALIGMEKDTPPSEKNEVLQIERWDHLIRDSR
jgi:hypothetical protein